MLHTIENAGKVFGKPGDWHILVFNRTGSKVVVILEPEQGPPPSKSILEQAATYASFNIPELKKLHPINQVKWFKLRKKSSCSNMEMITFKQLGQVIEVGGKLGPLLGVRITPVSEFSLEDELFWEGVRDKAIETGLVH